ncbi:CDC48 family AAA ATPase [Persicimonas caeni]|uniref:CDC48 family AAA ATPase n=1 Tax=Persicimonas caeni TaxID=2292766 RepID=A0A4Y6PZJ9_PERCE|nr:CDC48 family AAA ATPase [Persicimonas caeni]QDG53609.1 CDC48 family AAA ATPase [Persicimonas caeni]QED34830.1 CDC48 family AAA ATPase [Persicimonas caeni]
MTEEDSLRLQVAGANERDVGKGTARINKNVIEELGIRQGDVIEIHGQRTTAAIALPPYPEDEGLPIIRLDGLIRANAGVSMGDRVQVGAAETKPAKKVVLGPAQENLRLQGSGQALLRTLLERPLVAGDVVSTSVYRREPGMNQSQFPDEVFRRFFQQRAFGLQEIRLQVISTKPRGIVRVTQDTEIELSPEYVEPEESHRVDVTYDDIGGLGDAIGQVREMIELPLKQPALFQRLGIDPPKGVLLHGPPGTGKTLLARAVANESDAAFYHIAGPEIMGRYYGESEERLREIFEEAQNNSPAVIFFDEIDSIAPKREQVTGETERRVVAQLLTLMDGLEPRQNVVVVAATNRPDAVDEALRRPGRFDREIVIGVPDQEGRNQILNIHTRGMPLDEDVNVDELSHKTYGFVGADLAALAREAAIEALRRNLPNIDLDEEELAPEVLENLFVTNEDFHDALRRIQPSALREIMIQVPDVHWDDIGGLDQAKQQLREGIELPLQQPEAFRRVGIRPAKGFLLYGPPGTGKTLMAKAVAREAEANFVSTKSSDLLSKWYGESEQQIARLFNRARQVAPTVIFIDEIDSLAPQRGGGLGEPAVTERVVNTLLAEMDGLEGMDGVVVVGATNRPTLLDPALLRPGRFDEVVYVPVPEEEGRLKILQIHTEKMPLADDVDLAALASRTQGFTGADLENLVRRAGLNALRANLEADKVSMDVFEQALEQSHPSVTPEMESEYEQMHDKLKQENPGGRRQLGFSTGASEE